MKAEIEWLVAATRVFLQPNRPLPDTRALDWNALIELSRRHMLAPMVGAVALRDHRGLIPPEIVNRFEQTMKSTVRDDLELSAELVRVLGWFQTHGIAVVPLKGPVLASKLYGNASVRVSSDLDLLIRPGDLLAAKKVVEAGGYRLDSTLHWPCDAACFRSRDRQLSFGEHRRKIKLDLHWRILPPYFPAALDEQGIWKRLRSQPFGGATVPAFSPEDLLTFLCAHGAKHLWERLGWLVDVARLVHIEPAIDWTRVFEEARRTDTSRMLAVGLLLAQDLLGAEFPAAVAQRIASDRRARDLAGDIRSRIFAGPPRPAGAIESAWLSSRVFERPGQRVRYVFGLFLEPSEAEFRVLGLPSMLYGLYYPFRLLRLSGKFIAGSLASLFK